MIKYLTHALIIFLLIGCGSSGNKSNDNKKPQNTNNLSYLVQTNNIQNISLPQSQNVIASGSCTTTKIYDAKGTKYTPNIKPGNNYPIKYSEYSLGSAEYKVIFSEYFTKYTDSTAILFYLSGNFFVNELPLDTTITIPKRSAVLYKLTVNEDNNFLIEQRYANLQLYDASLNHIGSTDPWRQIKSNQIFSSEHSFLLKKGTYYIQGNVRGCLSQNADFMLVKL
jgi:uncharacterized protein YcfL